MNAKIINKLKEETNNSSYIVYREKYINNIKIDIIYNEVLLIKIKCLTLFIEV